MSVSIIKNYTQRLRYVSLSLLILLIPLYALLFHIRSYNLEIERRLGTELNELISPSFFGKLWCDFPTTLVYADWNPRQTISSDQIQRMITDHEMSINDVLIEENIQYIIAADYDHSDVLSLFPEMKLKEAFSIQEINFSPIKILDPIDEANEENASFFPRLASISIVRNKEMVLWEIDLNKKRLE
jgi:hypothetical protein